MRCLWSDCSPACGRGPAGLLWPVCPPAPRTGELRHCGQRRRDICLPQGPGAGGGGLFRRDAGPAAPRDYGGGPYPLRHYRGRQPEQLPAHRGQSPERTYGPGAQRKSEQCSPASRQAGAVWSYLPWYQRYRNHCLHRHQGAAVHPLHRGCPVRP